MWTLSGQTKHPVSLTSAFMVFLPLVIDSGYQKETQIFKIIYYFNQVLCFHTIPLRLSSHVVFAPSVSHFASFHSLLPSLGCVQLKIK